VPDDEGPPCVSWIDMNRIRAAIARDVLERVMDDRTSWARSVEASEVFTRLRAAARIKPKRVIYPRAAEPKPKVERTPEVKEYFRLYQRTRRQRQKADADLMRAD
jgi:hypothetical protein